MRAVVIVLGLVLDAVCIFTAGAIGARKGRAGYGAYGLLLGPVGVLIALAVRPTVGGGPEHDDMSRLAWVRREPGVPWTARKDLLGAATVAVLFVAWGITVIVYVVTYARPLDTARMDAQMVRYLADNGAGGATVTCPAEDAKAGRVFLCDVAGVPGIRYMQVTVLNSGGDISFEASP